MSERGSTPEQLDDRAVVEARQIRELVPKAQAGEQARLEIGRRLLAMRPTWPKSGPKASGWQAFLDLIGIEKRTAQRYMATARPKDPRQVSRTRKRSTTAAAKLIAALNEILERQHKIHGPFNYGSGLSAEREAAYVKARKKAFGRHCPDELQQAVDEYREAWIDERLAQVASVVGPAEVSESYDLLGVPPTATPFEIKAAYKRRAREVHPDHGGTTDQFIAVNSAYQRAMTAAGGAP